MNGKFKQLIQSCLTFPGVFGLVLFCLIVFWLISFFSYDLWRLILDYLPMELTMVLGSFVAGSTPAGGAAVAFPVFTKVLHVGASDARTFGLMIQSVGMTMASLFIVTQGIPVDWRIIRWGTGGGVLGLFLGAVFVPDFQDYPRIIFTCITTSLAVTIIFLHWYLKQKHDSLDLVWKNRQRLHFLGTGFLGGIIASLTGSGVDMTLYIVMTLGYGLAERLAIPTTVVCMAAVSVFGFFVHKNFLSDIPPLVWGYWTVCAPIVAVGAPLGAWVASIISRELLIRMIIFLAVLDLVSTIWLVRLDGGRILIMIGTFLFAFLWIRALLSWRKSIYSIK